ncbi:MAG: glycosyltransferase family 2 protein [Elusimicrobia bacterium]|nr:glycosyltransferase family 2 protein [Elusimicrobiota bacterium]
MPPRVSVLIDCFNHERTIEAAIAGVLSQDWSGCPREILVVDDGSADATRERVLRFSPDVRYIHQENQGQAQAFNAGFRASSGDILCFLDGDDLWYPGKIARTVQAFREHPEAVFVQNPLETVDAAGRPLRRPRFLPPARVVLQDVLDGKSVLVGTSGLSVRRAAFEKIAPVPKDLTTSADDYVSKHALFFGPAVTVPAILGGLRIHEGNSFQGLLHRPDRIERVLRMEDRLDAYFQARLDERGLAYSPAGLRARRLERKTKEILLSGWKGDRRRALSAWAALRRELPLSPFHAFKLGTLLLAALSPRAYLALHDVYADSRWLPAVRTAIFTDSSS